MKTDRHIDSFHNLPKGEAFAATHSAVNTSAKSEDTGFSAIQIPQISLPQGGGAIKGIDEKFEVNAANGTASFSIPLPFSPGRNGFMPAVSLSYNSGAGNGLFGLGWELSFPSIQRKTDRQLPRYQDGEETDTFMISGTEDLVPLLKKDAGGNWSKDEFTAGEYTIRRYRPRIEGGFSRMERITHPLYGMWWKVTSRDNVVTFFGKSSEYRIADPVDKSRIFQWLPELSFDDKGNCVRYEFKKENGHGYGLDLHDVNRFLPDGSPLFTNRYLKRVFYTNRRPFLPDFSITDNIYYTQNPVAGDFLLEMVLDYGEHGPVTPAAEDIITVHHTETLPWSIRRDAFSSYRAGFEIRTARLCRRVLSFHHFAELGAEPCLVRSLDLSYRDRSLTDEPEQGQRSEVTYLVAVSQRAYVRGGTGGQNYRFRSLPPFEFKYEELKWNKTVHSLAPEDIVHLPAGLTSGYQWVDLYNEGIAGILTEQGDSWFYKENLGEGQFSIAQSVISKPSFSGLSSGVLQLQDLEADGNRQVVVNSGGLNGYFELADDREWASFRAFAQNHNIDLRDPNTRLFDLNGDGRVEIVITEEKAFTWYPSAGKNGYGAAESVPKSLDEEQGPAIVFADVMQSIFLADMSGDGLTDIVRIRNGDICYWPNLGYGRFGAKVTMTDSPWFDLPDQFDPASLQLADVSGTGATDLIYLGKNQFKAWLNLSGNAWSQACQIDPFFDIAQPNEVSVIDLLGNGTACIVWSSPLPGNAGAPLRYIDLMGGKKPHVLTSYQNNLGQETTWTYKSSTHYYLEDKKAGKPWITKLPFPVQLISQMTVTDKWRNTRFSHNYSYHHGYYDHAEREFRGFGRVEQVDVEDFGTFVAGNINSPYITPDQTLYQPPVKTITWYHTGAFLSQERILNQFTQEYFQPNGGDFFENELPGPNLDTQDLSTEEYREALRACKGMVLRTEVYELDVIALTEGEQQPVKLFSTAFYNCRIRRLQPRRENQFAVFLATESEAITYHYELPIRNGQAVGEADPRIAHTFNLRIDEYGQPLQTLAVAYPRWRDAALNDPLMPAGAEALIREVQREMHVVYSENRFTNDHISAADYRLRVPCETLTYELTGFQRTAGKRYFNLADWRPYRLSTIHQATGLPVEEIAYQALPNHSTPQKRPVEQVRSLFFADNLRDPLPFGQLNRLGLPYETYQVALTEDLLNSILGDQLATLQQNGEAYPEMLGRVLTEGGYHRFPDEPGNWWLRSGIAGFSADAAAHFFLPERYSDPFGATTTLQFDPYDLYIRSSEDPLQNRVEVTRFDYRVLAPLEMKDINDNLSEVAFDIMGMPAAVAVKGKGQEGDSLNGLSVDLDLDELIAFFTGDYNENTAQDWLGNASARHLYYFGETVDAAGVLTYGHHPACGAAILREKHLAQLSPGEQNRLQIAFEYSDGSGAVIASKAQAEPESPGGPFRWITNGKTVLNNKGNPVKQYEPYFTAHHRFEEPQEVGVTPVIYYDASGRTLRTDMPDGTYSRTMFSPWFTKVYDPNDTVFEPGNAWYESYRQGSESQRRAAQLALIHQDTPACTYTDSLGRAVIAVAHNRYRKPQGDGTFNILEEKYLTYTKLDAEGKPLWLQDARGNCVMVYARVQNPADFQNMHAASGYTPAYDLAGNLLFQHSNEAGDRWMLPDSTGQPMYVWDENEYAGVMEQRVMRSEYDALRRPKRQWLRINDEVEKEIGRTIYGEELANPEANNLRGQAVRSLGPEGRMEAVAFDFKGNLLESRRQLLADATVHTMDWNGFAASDLSPEVFVQRTQYDALNRMTRLENWHLEGRTPAIYHPVYNRRGVLESETLSVRGQVAEAIRRIEYNAKGQRERIQYGNGTTTRYSYDPNTFRLTRLLTTANNGADKLQDLHYTYDPSGNITEIEDQAYEPVFFRNQRVEPRSRYEYDALYRLIEAGGRENYHASGAPKGYGTVEDLLPHNFGSGDQALRNYTQRYEYDPAGNFVTLQHLANGGSWTRRYETEAQSNRLLRTWLGDDQVNAVRYRYDTHGSLLNFTNTQEANHNHWDYRDMIHTLDLEGGGTAYYQYDAEKQRTRKRIERQGNEYWERLYFGGYELYRRYRNGQLIEETETHHLFAGEQRVLIYEDVLLPSPLGGRGGARYQYGNHLGSVGLECDDTGRIISYEEYHPYGTTAYQARNATVQLAAKRYRYTGMERDEESGLAYHTARYYLPWLGRWGSVDPIGVEGGWGVYNYGSNNPLKFIDVRGTDIDLHAQFLNRLESSAEKELNQEQIHKTELLTTTYISPKTKEVITRKHQYRIWTPEAAKRGLQGWTDTNSDGYWRLKLRAEDLRDIHADPKRKAEFDNSWKRIENAEKFVKLLGGVGLGSAALIMAAPVVLKGGTYAATSYITSPTVYVGTQFVYGAVMPPTAPDLPGPFDNGGRALRRGVESVDDAVRQMGRLEASADIPTITIRYTDKLASNPSEAATLRYLIDWLQEGDGFLIRSMRSRSDAAMRKAARKSLIAQGIDISGQDASHLVDDAIAGILHSEGSRKSVYIFLSSSINRSFGGSLGRGLNNHNIPVGGRFRIEFSGDWPDIPPSFSSIPMWWSN